MGRLNSGNTGDALKKRKNDCYETPPEAVHALLNCEPILSPIWEPACGSGAIVKVLREAKHEVIATDLVDYGCPDSQSRIDFLMEYRPWPGVYTIITNPPFKNGADFVRKGLELCHKVMIFQRIAFFEGAGRSDIMDSGQLARIHVFKNRLPMMHRLGWDGRKIGRGMAAYAWFIWDRDHTGPTTIDRISWEPIPEPEKPIEADPNQLVLPGITPRSNSVLE